MRASIVVLSIPLFIGVAIAQTLAHQTNVSITIPKSVVWNTTTTDLGSSIRIDITAPGCDRYDVQTMPAGNAVVTCVPIEIVTP
jgi:hypothetical protein